MLDTLAGAAAALAEVRERTGFQWRKALDQR